MHRMTRNRRYRPDPDLKSSSILLSEMTFDPRNSLQQKVLERMHVLMEMIS